MKKRLVMSTQAQADLAALDRAVALRVAAAIHRFVNTGAGNVKILRGTHPPEFRLRAGDYRVRFYDHGEWIEILRVKHRKDAYR